MKNICGKTRQVNKGQTPYITWTDPHSGWKYRLLKSYQTNHREAWARWFVACNSPATHGSWEMGDQYADSLYPGLMTALAFPDNIEWDHGVWPDHSDLVKWVTGK